MRNHQKIMSLRMKIFGWFLVLMLGAFLPLLDPVVNLKKTFLTNENQRKFLNSSSQMIVSTSASLLVATLIETWVFDRELKERRRKRKILKVLFGDDLEVGRTAILLPKFDQHKIDTQVLGTEIQTDETDFLSFSDTQAAMEVISLFEKNDLVRPELIFDDDKNIKIEEYKTLFVIGLCSNHLFLRDPSEGLSLSKENQMLNVKISSNPPPVGHLKLTDSSGTKEKLKDTNNEKIGIIAKMKKGSQNSPTNIIIVGGISARTTAKCGKHLKDQIEEISNFRDVRTGKEVGGNEFLITLKYDAKRSDLAPKKFTYVY